VKTGPITREEINMYLVLKQMNRLKMFKVIVYLIVILLCSCNLKQGNETIAVEKLSHSNTNMGDYPVDSNKKKIDQRTKNLSSGNFEIKEMELFKITDYSKQFISEVDSFTINEKIYKAQPNVRYVIKDKRIMRYFGNDEYKSVFIDVVVNSTGDKEHPFSINIEDSLVVQLGNHFTFGAEQDVLFHVEKVLFPKNKYDFLVSSNILVQFQTDAEFKVVSGNLSYIREEEINNEYPHYGYSLYVKEYLE
jgi:hypothetical protein